MNPRLRAQVFAEWRGYHEKREDPQSTRPVADALRKVVAKYRALETVDEAALQAAWKSIVGDFLAQHSTPGRYRNGVLTVHVSQSGVLYELDRVWKRRILQGLRQRFPKVKLNEIRFSAG